MVTRLLLIVVSGKPGSGKSPIAQRLGDRSQLWRPVVSHDAVRSALRQPIGPVDDRGTVPVQRSVGLFYDALRHYLEAGDALAGMRFLQSHPAVDGRRVGFFGSSQGGWIVPIAASRARDAAFAILHSAPAVPVWRQDLDNVEHSMRAAGFAEPVMRRAVPL